MTALTSDDVALPLDPRFLGLHFGVVTDRDDPEGLGRVRVRVPGLVEPESAWAWPLGTAGGGAAGHGFFAIPPVGADCGVLFAGGDPDAPAWIAGPWGRGEVPEEGRAGPDVRVLAAPSFSIVLDERAGAEVLRLINRRSGDVVELDATSNRMTLRATTDLQIKAVGRISLDALTVVINGRVVAPSPEPIT